MSKLSITENNWINIVFEGKNKEYGAYQLRKESDKTTLLAFFMGVLIITSLVSISALINLFLTTETIKIEVPDYSKTIVQLSDIRPSKPKKPVKLITPVAKKTTSNPQKKQLTNPIIVKPSEANQNIVKSTATSTTTSESTEGKGSNTSPILNTTEIGVETPSTSHEKINTPTSLDKLPEFPGGIGKFYNYVGNNFQKPELDDEKKVQIYVYFVIERDGSMTDIQVKNNPGYGLDKEAIRVLKSLKTKWSPGMIDGKAVRTSYNLPIIIMTQN